MSYHHTTVTPVRGLPEPHHQSLATGFRDVDLSGDSSAYHRCLDLITGIPFFHEIKEDTFRIIADTGPVRVLDAGCGAGADLFSLASRLPAECQIFGLDASESLLARAAEWTNGVRNRCSLIRGDIMDIPCHNGVFDSCRIDRVLQHLHNPKQGIRELTRVLKPGGILVAFDNDWDTFSISLDDQDLAARFTGFWRDSFASGRIGYDLPGIFKECRMADIHEVPRTLVLADFSIAEQLFDIPLTIRRAQKEGVLNSNEADIILKELNRKDAENRFLSGYTGYIVTGKKPE